MTDMPKEIYVQRAKCTVTNELSYSCDPEQILIDDTKYVRKDKTITVELLEGMKCTDKPSDDLDDGRFFEEVRIQEGRNEVLNELINKLKRRYDMTFEEESQLKPMSDLDKEMSTADKLDSGFNQLFVLIENHEVPDYALKDKLNEFLDRLRDEDYFGTEGQNDPREDWRNNA